MRALLVNFVVFCGLLGRASAGSTSARSCWRNTSCSGPTEAAFPGKWEANIYAPESRTIPPKSVLSCKGKYLSAWPAVPAFAGNGSCAVLDFGIEVGGIVSVDFISTGAGELGLAFSESKTYIGEWSDSSNGGFKGPDGALYATFTGAGEHRYTMPDARLRGGFRYMTVFQTTKSEATVTKLNSVKLEIGFQPTWSNLQAYQGYFHSNDDLLNQIWYSGAYTLQTNAVPVDTGRAVPFVRTGWANDGTLGPGDTIIVDGAKRDRAVWPGDMGIAVPSTFVSIGDLESVKNALQVMYNYQNPTTGAFPEAGPPLLQLGSDTYHMWTMIGTYNYVLYTDDTAFLKQNWAKYLLAMKFIYGKVDSTGLMDQTGLRDWARWQTGGYNTEAQMILYRTLITGSSLAKWANDTTGLSTRWASEAATLKSHINAMCYDSPYGAFKDNVTMTKLHPQDANSMSLLFGVADPASMQATNISTNLLKNWTPIGAVTPELPDNISPFISSFEIQGHFTIGRADRALNLIRRCWGWYLNNPNGTGSTVIEGYLQNGSFGYRSSRGYNYDPSYTSHSHGWSSGPTSALTSYVVGMTVTSPAGATWQLAPQFGDLLEVEGGFSTKLGKYQAKWALFQDGYTLSYSTPAGTTGVLELPTLVAGQMPRITYSAGCAAPASNGTVAGNVVKMNVAGGSCNITVGQ